MVKNMKWKEGLGVLDDFGRGSWHSWLLCMAGQTGDGHVVWSGWVDGLM
jgi:hypothetical protein